MTLGANLLADMRCPATGSRLATSPDGSLVSADRRRSYSVVGGVPILIAAEKSLFDPAAIARQHASGGEPTRVGEGVHDRRWLKRLGLLFLNLPPTASRNVSAAHNYSALQDLLRERSAYSGQPVRLLVVGGATAGVGFERILGDTAIEVVETDVYIGPRTQIVCDGHDLPFADGTFDGVVCQAVFGQVIHPSRIAEEIWRVLRPDGYVYSEAPFMQQVYAGALDFTRFTHVGHRRLWRWFDELRSGAQGGPGMALIWSIRYFARSFSPRQLWPVVDRLTTSLFFWVKYLDEWLVKRPAALDAASGTFFLGRRRASPIDDMTILRAYRGIGPRLLD
jgi:SAM-dependent methyltransferase